MDLHAFLISCPSTAHIDCINSNITVKNNTASLILVKRTLRQGDTLKPLPFSFYFVSFLVHLSRRLKCTIVITRCPSVRPSVRLSVVNFSHFQLLLWNCWMEFNETWQEARSQRPLPSSCFSGRSEKQDGRPGLWLAETFSTSPLKLLNRVQRNLTGSKISTSSTKFVFFWADRKNKMAALASDWLRHFRLLLWNRWMEFNETWQEARSQCPLPSLCFLCRSEKQDGRPGLWLAETFSTSLKPLNGI